MISLFLKANIEKNGDYQVITANSGKAALEISPNLKSDFIILAIKIPDIDRVKGLRELCG